MELQSRAAATLVFENKAKSTTQIDFSDWKTAILAAYEQLSPAERATAFIYSAKNAFNSYEIMCHYELMTA